jgi:MANEC domain
MTAGMLCAVFLAIRLISSEVRASRLESDSLLDTIPLQQSNNFANYSELTGKKSSDQKRFIGRSGIGDCSVAKERSDTIIKTKESQAAGAIFVASPPITSRDECIAECCNAKSCNTAVVKEKVIVLSNALQNRVYLN